MVSDDSIPLEYQRILTEEDFERIRELRHKKMVTSLMQKHGLKSAAKRERLLAAAEEEAEENLDAQVRLFIYISHRVTHASYSFKPH